jgi:glucose-6-phosphate 1-epimerase
MTRIALQAQDGARAEVYRHGAHVTSWIPAGSSDERLYLSARSSFSGDSAIRGGVPVIFPQFAAMGPLPKHGFARTCDWDLSRVDTVDGAAEARLQLTDSPATRAIWPHAFAAELAVVVHGSTLTITLLVENRDTVPFMFTSALHTYLRVEDIGKTVINGLAGRPYRDSANGGVEGMDSVEPLRVPGYIDRIYLEVPGIIEVREPHRVMRVSATGFPDAVVWNPGAERGAALADLEPDGYRRMLCVEAAAIGAPIHLAPGERWNGAQRLIAATH